MAVLATLAGLLGTVGIAAHVTASGVAGTLTAGFGNFLRIIGEAVFAAFMSCHGLSSSVPLAALIAAFRALPGVVAEYVAAALAGVLDAGPGLALGAVVGRMLTALGCVHAAPLGS